MGDKELAEYVRAAMTRAGGFEPEYFIGDEMVCKLLDMIVADGHRWRAVRTIVQDAIKAG